MSRPQLLTIDQVAHAAGITPGHVYRWARRHGIRPHRVRGDRRHLYHVADVRAALGVPADPDALARLARLARFIRNPLNR